MKNINMSQVADSIYEAIHDSPKKSKKMLLKTLLKMFGYKMRRQEYLHSMESILKDAGVFVFPALLETSKTEWVTLSVIIPQLPQQDFSQEMTDEKIDGDTFLAWLNTISKKSFNSEKEVEIRFILPLLEMLGYDEDDRSDGYPVEQVVGVKKTKTVADFVLFDGANRCKNNALLVIEAKNIGTNLVNHIGQARSYAMFLGTPYYLVTNGVDIKVFLYRSPVEADVEVFISTRQNIESTFKSLFNLISKDAIIAYRKSKSQD